MEDFVGLDLLLIIILRSSNKDKDMFLFHIVFFCNKRLQSGKDFMLTLYNKLYIVASCWTIIDIDSRCTDP